MKRFLFACVVAAVACQADTTGPENSEAKWELREIDGVPTIVGTPSGDTVPQIRFSCNTNSGSPTYTVQVIVKPKWAFSSTGPQSINFDTAPGHDLFGNNCPWTISGGNASCTTNASGVRAYVTKISTNISVQLSFFAPDGDDGTIVAKNYPSLTLPPLITGAFSECDAAEP
jgi:hypothetical protein